MIARLRRVNREQRKLLFSVGTAFLARVPGAIGVLWFLPLLRFGLGTDDYAILLTSIALGGAAGFLSVGFNYVGRRLIGEAYADGNRVDETNGFASLVLANMVAFGVALAIIAAYCWVRGASTSVLVIATLPALIPILGQFDDVRGAYNEYYVSATLSTIIQSTVYAVGLLVPATRHSLVLGALVLTGPYLISSLITLALLLRTRPYLTRGRPVAFWRVIREGTLLAISEGFVMATLGLSVVWLQTSATSATAAWYGTLVRLFQTFLMPVILLLFPMSNYIRLRWNGKSVAEQRSFTKATLMLGLGYGAIVAAALLVGSWLYVGWLLHLPAPGGLLQILPILLLFGAIVAYRAYSQVAFVVLEETMHLSSWTALVTGVAAALGVAASAVVDPLSAISVYALAAGLSLVAVLIWNVSRLVRPSSTCIGPHRESAPLGEPTEPRL